MLQPHVDALAAVDGTTVPLTSAKATFEVFDGDIELALNHSSHIPGVTVRGLPDLMNLYHSLSDVLAKLVKGF